MLYIAVAIVFFFIYMFGLIKFGGYADLDDFEQFWLAELVYVGCMLWPVSVPLTGFAIVAYYGIKFMKKKWGNK